MTTFPFQCIRRRHSSIDIPIIKIRRCHDRVIVIMGNSYSKKDGLCLDTVSMELCVADKPYLIVGVYRCGALGEVVNQKLSLLLYGCLHRVVLAVDEEGEGVLGQPTMELPARAVVAETHALP